MAHYAPPPPSRVSIGPDGVLTYRGRYVPELVSGFKRIPFAYRDYAPDDGKVWTIKPPYVEEALTLVLRYVPEAEVHYSRQTRSQASTHTRPNSSDPFRVLHLRETAPVELIESAYKVLARLHHPDRGGTTEAMQQLNGAYAALRERVSA